LSECAFVIVDLILCSKDSTSRPFCELNFAQIFEIQSENLGNELNGNSLR
jgi:hypothetical protein